MSDLTIGIDLGTTHSAAGLLGPDGRPRLVAIDGAAVLPSVVSFPDPERVLVGAPALNRLAFDPDHTVRSAKRHMGRDTTWPIHGQDLDAPAVQAEVLRRLAAAVAADAGEAPARAVITVPARFDQTQRQATRRAAELAGLEVVRLLNEPTAAALAHHPTGGARQLLVYDLGGGTFDASVVRQEGELTEVLASHGDAHLGGDDLDRRLADLLVARWAAAHDADPAALQAAVRADPAATVRLALAAEAAKRELSRAVETTVRLDCLLAHDGLPPHLEVALARADVERAARPLLERTLSAVEQALADAGLAAADLDGVLLVGGMTRVPLVRELLRDRLGREPDASLHPDECVAQGAVVQAGIASGAAVERVLVDVAPFALSWSHLHDGDDELHMRCRVVTPRNSPLPSRRAEVFHALAPEQDRVVGYIFQGDDLDPLANRCIARAELTGLARRAGEEVPQVAVELRYDLDGVVHATLANAASGRHSRLRLDVEGLAERDLMDDFCGDLERHGIAPGPGRPVGDRPAPRLAVVAPADSPPDPAPPADPTPPAATALLPPERPAGLPPDLEGDYRVLERVAAHLPELERRHGDGVAPVRRALEESGRAFRREPVDPALARAAADRVSDLLFDLGEFL